jgi:hypothetical protein
MIGFAEQAYPRSCRLVGPEKDGPEHDYDANKTNHDGSDNRTDNNGDLDFHRPVFTYTDLSQAYTDG